MNAISIMTGGMVAIPWVAMQKCLSDRDIQHISAHASVTPSVQVRIQVPDRPPSMEPLFPPVPMKPIIRASAVPPSSVVVTRKATAPAPPGPTPPLNPTPDKPTVRVKRNGCGNGKTKLKGPKT